MPVRSVVIIAGLILSSAVRLSAQDVATGRVSVAVASSDGPLSDALVRVKNAGAQTGADGKATLSVIPGDYTVVVSKLGYGTDSLPITVGPGADTTVSITLIARSLQIAPVVVTSARGEHRIEDVPVRVEVLSGEDVDEKTAMRPGNLTQLVAEIPGVHVQQLPPTAGGTALRIQGLRGQYTSFLTDGLPLTGSSDGGLSIVQTPPLDLFQVEVLKGSSSALYGPSALGGVINFITRRAPAEGKPPIRDLVVAASSRGSSDAVAFIGDRLNGRLGYTLLAGVHHDPITDPDADGWADMSRSSRAEVRPRLFWRGARGGTTLLTFGASIDNRLSGTVRGDVTPAGTSFRDALKTVRGDVGLISHVVLAGGPVLTFRGSLAEGKRDRALGGARERDRSSTGFMEASVTGSHSLIEWVGGAALRRDGYRDRDASGFDYGFVTSSAFAQATLAAGRQVSASVTGRCDHHSRYGAACVPLAAILFKQAAGWSERLTAGLGDYAPTPITEETQATGLSRFRPFVGPGAPAIVYERARHATLDVGFHKGPIDLNATVYATRIANPLEVRDFVTGPLVSELVNASGPMNSRGLDLFAVYNAEPVAITVFYGLARTREERTVSESPETEVLVEREVPLNPRIRGGLDVALDLDETGTRLTAEAYYTGKQAIDDDPYRSVTRPFTTVEFLATQNVGSVQLFLSAENLTNVRQTSFDPLLLPAMARNGRWTTDAWAPLEGRTLRAGLRARL